MRSSTRPLVRVRFWRQGLEHSVVLFGHDCLLENDSRTINVYQRELTV